MKHGTAGILRQRIIWYRTYTVCGHNLEQKAFYSENSQWFKTKEKLVVKNAKRLILLYYNKLFIRLFYF